MTTLTLPLVRRLAPPPLGSRAESYAMQKSRLLVFTADEAFWQKLLSAGSAVARKLVRKRDSNNARHTLRLVKPGAVLLDLDRSSAWDTADALLQDIHAPPLLLLTSYRDHVDFGAAIAAGSLIDKGSDAGKLLALADIALAPSQVARRERNAMQQLVIRWLKPCAWFTRHVPLRRFWGINE